MARRSDGLCMFPDLAFCLALWQAVALLPLAAAPFNLAKQDSGRGKIHLKLVSTLILHLHCSLRKLNFPDYFQISYTQCLSWQGS